MSRLLGVVVRVALILLLILPAWVGLVAAFTPEGSIFSHALRLSPAFFVPMEFTFENFAKALELFHFPRQLVNTFVIGLIQPTLIVILGMLAAFPLSRMRFRGREVVFLVVIATMLMPYEAILVPMFLQVQNVGLLDSYAGLVVPWLASPIVVFMLRQAMLEVPSELDDAVVVDGGGVVRILRTAVVPNIWPMTATAWLFMFILVFDAYLWPAVVVNNPEVQVAQVGIASLFSERATTPYGTALAAGFLAVAPVLLVFFWLQRFYIRSAATGGIK